MPFRTRQPLVDRSRPDGADGRKMPLLRLEEYSESACPLEDEVRIIAEPEEAKEKLIEFSAPQPCSQLSLRHRPERSQARLCVP